MPVKKLDKERLFKEKLTVDFLNQSYCDHTNLVEEMALSEIHSVQTAMPVFNTLAALTKFEFNKFMNQLLRFNHNKDGKMYAVMVAGTIDTFTSMIQSNKLYEDYLIDNKYGMQLMVRLLHTFRCFIIQSKVLDNIQLRLFIGILEKSFKRIKENLEDQGRLTEDIIESFKTVLARYENIEDKTVDNENVNSHFINGFSDKENFVLKDNIKETNKLVKLKTTTLPHLSETKSEGGANKKRANAFDAIMASSKMLVKKRKVVM